MADLTLKIYDKAGKKAVKTYKAKPFDLMYGTVADLMELVKVEDMTDDTQLLKTVYQNFDGIKEVLSQAFPDITEDEWRRVKVRDLVPTIAEVIKYAISEAMTIPTDSKN